MKNKQEIEQYNRKIDARVREICEQKGHKAGPCHNCSVRGAVAKAAYESCIPRAFWQMKDADIKYNRDVFENVVLKYIEKLNVALDNGFGLTFCSDNGSGKTSMVCYALMEAIRRGRSVYYTTAPQLDYNLKRGFNDSEFSAQLEVFLLSSDWLAIDEIGKVRNNTQNDFVRTSLERIIKHRADNKLPTLIASNLDLDAIESEYGDTIMSVLQMNETVYLEPGDYREELAKKMREEMGYN